MGTISDTHSFIDLLKDLGNEDYAAQHTRFFKTGPGEYAEGDLFLGNRSPDLRRLSKEYYLHFKLVQMEELLHNKFHEVRAVALMMMTLRFNKKTTSEQLRKEILNGYVNHLEYVNNWDLVDISAHKIVGAYAVLHPVEGEQLILELSQSTHLWTQRVAVVSTWMLIKHGRYDVTLKLAVLFINHSHDLMHKACGWMLREVGKKDQGVLLAFLDEYSQLMPRTALRYAIEKLSPSERAYYLKK